MLKMLAVVVAVVATLAGTVASTPAQKRGGVLKFAVPSVKPGLDPAHTSTGDGYMLTQAIFSNRWWPLVLLFLTLEALLFGSAAAWVWARNSPVEEVADEVLSP